MWKSFYRVSYNSNWGLSIYIIQFSPEGNKNEKNYVLSVRILKEYFFPTSDFIKYINLI